MSVRADWLQSAVSHYNRNLAMLDSNKNGKVEVTWFSVSTTYETLSVIQSNELCNTSGLTAPGARVEVDGSAGTRGLQVLDQKTSSIYGWNVVLIDVVVIR